MDLHQAASGALSAAHSAPADVAEQLFAAVDSEATTTNAIAARSGMSPGSLYQFFPKKTPSPRRSRRGTWSSCMLAVFQSAWLAERFPSED